MSQDGGEDYSPSPSAPQRIAIMPLRLRYIVAMGTVSLLLGLLIGSGLTSFLLHRSMIRAMGRHKDMPDEITHRMTAMLDLSPDQVVRIRAIVQIHDKKMDAIRREMDPKMRTELEGIRTEVDRVLSESQRQKWQKHMDQMSRNFPPSGYPPPPPPGSFDGPPPHFAK